MIIEYARNVLGWQNAQHAETDPDAILPVIHQLECSLVEETRIVRFIPNTKIAVAYGCVEVEETYHCRFGLNPAFENGIISTHLQVGARDEQQEVRSVELVGVHPFFVATLFQHERIALQGEIPPLVLAFIQAIQLQKRNK
jgi:CTP synthase (UTP-ammonia lyase)